MRAGIGVFGSAVGVLVSGLLGLVPAASAQPLEVADPTELAREVASQVESLMTEVAARDPELAQEIERQQDLCVRDLGDGRLDHEGFARDIENFREVQRELAERALEGEVETRIAEASARGDTELADQMRAAFEAMQAGDAGLGRPEFGGPSEMSHEQAQAMFERAYQEALSHDPEGAQRMKEMFESVERGEMFHPSPDMMERMHGEMEQLMSERPDMAEYARAEWDRFMDFEHEGGDRFGSMESPEHMREMFEHMAAEGGGSPADIDRMRAEMERGFAEMERGIEMGHEVAMHEAEQEREMMERDFTNILDSNSENFGNPQPGDNAFPHVEVAPGQWDGGDQDMLPDHTHPPGAPPHTGS